MSIKSVCPWSHRYWMDGRITHVRATPGTELTFVASWCATDSKALLFEYPANTDVDTLYAITEKIEAKYLHLAAFWSHPDHKDNNTPKPCVIVQDKGELTDLRKQIGYEETSQDNRDE